MVLAYEICSTKVKCSATGCGSNADRKDFAGNIVHEDSALLMDAMTVLSVVVSAATTVSNQSALGNSAPQPLLQGEGVSSTAGAEQHCAR